MKRQAVLALAYIAAAVAIAAPVLIAIHFTMEIARARTEDDASELAKRSLMRNEQITDQVFQALADLESGHFSSPCSDESLEIMRKSVMKYSRLQAVGYIDKGHMLCSSLGRHPNGGIDVGKIDYVSSNGLEVRSDRHLPFDESSVYRISASSKSGYAAIVHTDLAFDIVDLKNDEGAGLIGTTNMKPISKVGFWRGEWSSRLKDAEQVTFVDGDYVVGLRRSLKYNYFTYSALSIARLKQEERRVIELLLPIGLLAGMALVTAVYFVTRQQLGLAAQLRSALARGKELFVLYQPIVNLETGTWVGAEALIRWKRPNGEFINPEAFVEIAERNGFVGLITKMVIDTIKNDAAILLSTNPDFFISINLAADDLKTPSIQEQLKRAVDELGIKPFSLKLEATERSFIDAEVANKFIFQLRSMGHSVVIDDFGTGYSSLSYLASLHVEGLKIDRAFVSTIGTGAVTAQVVPHIIQMGKSLNMKMVAEGVETPEQEAYLREHGVQKAQGWLYSKAVTIAEIEKRLRDQKHEAKVKLESNTVPA